MRQPLTVNVDENVLDALPRAAARDGVPKDKLVDEALRRWFGLRGLSCSTTSRSAKPGPPNILAMLRRWNSPSRKFGQLAQAGGRPAAELGLTGCGVLDLNVFVSALINPAGVPAGVVRLELQRRYEIVLCPRLLDELEEVL